MDVYRLESFLTRLTHLTGIVLMPPRRQHIGDRLKPAMRMRRKAGLARFIGFKLIQQQKRVQFSERPPVDGTDFL